MPEYAFVRSDDETISCLLFYRMAEVPSVGSEIADDQGIVWRRVFTSPNAAISITSDPYSSRDFKARTDNKNLTLGNLFDMSKEASDKRASKEGKDPIREKYLADYSKARKGYEHSVTKREKFEAKQKEIGIAIKNVGRAGR